MDFESLDKMAPADRQLLIDHLVQSLLGKPMGEPIVIRRTLKLSTLSSDEEIKKQIAEAFSMPVEKFANVHFSKEVSGFKTEYEKLQHLIAPYHEYLLSGNAKADKIEELNDIGRFLIKLGRNFTIPVPPELLPYPDFIIEGIGKKIGIEHTRLIDAGTQRFIKNIRQILKTAENILRQNNTSLIHIVNIGFRYDVEIINNKSLSAPQLSKADKDAAGKVVAEFVEAYFSSPYTAKPSFIDTIQVSADSVHPVSLHIIENYVGKTDIELLLTERLDSKEAKYPHYAKAGKMDEIWLVIIANGSSAGSSFIIDDPLLKNKITSNFDKVYLFEVFSGIYTLIHDSGVS